MDKPIDEAVQINDEMVERACKRYAFREDGATFPDDYSEYEVLAERKLMRDFLTHVLAERLTTAQQQGQAVLSSEDRRAMGWPVGDATPQPMQQGGGEVAHEVEGVLREAQSLAHRINYSADHDEAVTLSADLRLLLQKALSIRTGLSLFRHPKWGGTAPPSAPVGVEGLIADWKSDLAEDRQNGVDGTLLRIQEIHIKQLSAIAQQPAAVDEARFRKAPCYLCGYNGSGYFQPETHPCAARYHATQHQEPTT